MENESSTPAPRETPLYSAGKKIVFIGALLAWGGFYLPWFFSITITGPELIVTRLITWNFSIVTQTADAPSGAEIPFCLGWIILGMVFLVVILPDSFPELGTEPPQAHLIVRAPPGRCRPCFSFVKESRRSQYRPSLQPRRLRPFVHRCPLGFIHQTVGMVSGRPRSMPCTLRHRPRSSRSPRDETLFRHALVSAIPLPPPSVPEFSSLLPK